MRKPDVFNAIKAMERIDELEYEVKKLKDTNTNLEIRCRIAEEDKGNMTNLINTQQDTINKYGEIFTLLNARIAQYEQVTICEVVDLCEECPRYANDCDGGRKK